MWLVDITRSPDDVSSPRVHGITVQIGTRDRGARLTLGLVRS